MSSSDIESGLGEAIAMAGIEASEHDTLRGGYRNLKGCTFGSCLSTNPAATDRDVIDTLVQLYGAERIERLLVGIFLLKRQTIGIATLASHAAFPGEKTRTQAIHVIGFEQDQLLTSGLRDPTAVGSCDQIVTHTDFVAVAKSPCTQAVRKMVVISWETCRTYALWLVWFASLLSIGTGVLVGLRKESLELGLVATGSNAAVLVVMEGALIWYLR